MQAEPVAIVVATEESSAELAVRKIQVNYEPLPLLLTPSQSLLSNAPLIHDRLDCYKKNQSDLYPEARTNIVSHYHMRKRATADSGKTMETE